MGQKIESTPKRQLRRVAAWIYAVINPVLESLQDELSFLDEGNLTWRANSGRCERIRNIQEYVDTKQWPNYFDFCSEHDAFKSSFHKHDNDLKRVNSEAKSLYDFLLSSPLFSQTLAAHLQSYEDQRASIGPQAPSFINSRSDIPKAFWEYVINNTRVLPSHYLYSYLWNFKTAELLAYRNDPKFAPLLQAAGVLGQQSAVLKAELEEHRLSLSRQFDVPAAPVAGISFEE